MYINSRVCVLHSERAHDLNFRLTFLTMFFGLHRQFPYGTGILALAMQLKITTTD